MKRAKKPEYTTVSIPVELAEKIRKRIGGTGFPNLSSFVIYVLRQFAQEGEISEQDMKGMRERLKKMGYI